MTFIASVIAKKGVALIADSLVTTTVPSIQIGEFIDFLKNKADKTKEDEINLTPEEIIELFKSRPSHTKDFEDKIFKFDEFTAITSAGAASINDKRISTLIKEIILINNKDKSYNRKKIETKVNVFCDFLEEQIKTHLKNKSSIRPTKFILSHYNKKKNLTQIYKINVNSASKKDLKDNNFEFVSKILSNDWEKVVCDGQNRISERILFGALDDIYSLIPRIANRVIADYGIKISEIDIQSYINSLRMDKDIISPNLFEEMKIFKLSELSLQQAVDLASLLMRIEIDFQTYTENIPTVGGVIKLAIIDSNGFKFISGHEIIKPNMNNH